MRLPAPPCHLLHHPLPASRLAAQPPSALSSRRALATGAWQWQSLPSRPRHPPPPPPPPVWSATSLLELALLFNSSHHFRLMPSLPYSLVSYLSLSSYLPSSCTSSLSPSALAPCQGFTQGQEYTFSGYDGWYDWFNSSVLQVRINIFFSLTWLLICANICLLSYFPTCLRACLPACLPAIQPACLPAYQHTCPPLSSPSPLSLTPSSTRSIAENRRRPPLW